VNEKRQLLQSIKRRRILWGVSWEKTCLEKDVIRGCRWKMGVGDKDISE